MKKFIAVLVITSVISVGMTALIPGSNSIAHASVSDWQRGASIVPQSTTDFSGSNFQQSVQNLKATGANYVTLVIPYYQSNDYSTDIAPGWNTPTDTALASAIDYAHGLGMHVVLKPHVETYSGDWRANINPSDRNGWFTTYGGILNHLASIGQAHQVEGFIIGSELIDMSTYTSNPANTQAWINMINDIRTRFSGFLTYSANWGSGDFAEEVPHIGFWSALDYIGISAYYPLYGDGSVQSEISQWDSWRTQKIEPIHNQYNKPILFTEVGYRSIDNAHNYPFDAGVGGNYNGTEQANLYQALFQYWNQYNYFAGVELWNWNIDPNAGGQGNTDYIPQNKPAQDVMKQYFTGGGDTTTTPPDNNPQSGTWNAQASVNNAQQNQQATINATVTNSDSANDVIADLEIYNNSGSRVYQKFYEHQTISGSQPGSYQLQWTPSETGQYTLKLGVFSNNWSTNYYWNDSVVTFNVTGSTPPPPPPSDNGNGSGDTGGNTGTTTPPTPPANPGSYTTNIWWPGDGAQVTGVQPFKAMLEGLSVDQYKMYWQVDGDRLNEMSDSNQDYPHKESLVDLSGWNWKGTGPYNINFVSKDLSGNILGQQSVNIKVGS